ncbi:uncharacterized protein [Hemitrygon akajei]|uniref:uncharacterized protein n=1 Tax=Hemitrygon akajei TaxID=2704970 RepID=UPI003BFA18FC
MRCCGEFIAPLPPQESDEIQHVIENPMVESVLTGRITAWYGNTNAFERKILQKVVGSAQYITGLWLGAEVAGDEIDCEVSSINPSSCGFMLPLRIPRDSFPAGTVSQRARTSAKDFKVRLDGRCKSTTCCYYCEITIGMAVEGKKHSLVWRQAGDSVTLTCKYQFRSDPNGYLDIEWTIKSKSWNESDNMIITLSGGKVYKTLRNQNISFVSGKGDHGDASLNFESLVAADSGIYYCKVKTEQDLHQESWNLTVQGKEQKSEDEDITVAPNSNTTSAMNSTESSDLSSDDDASSYKWKIGICLGVTGLVLFIIILIICLILKVKTKFQNRTVVNDSVQTMEYQDNIIYSTLQSTDQDITYSTIQSIGQDALYTTLQEHKAIEKCDQPVICTPQSWCFTQSADSVQDF